jgi:3-oxoacyl-[acyl-carrier protein] reductase
MAEKRLAVVTGAARGIGRAIVLELLQQGRRVAALDIMEDQLKDLTEAIGDSASDLLPRCADITDTAKLTEILEALASEYGGIGILVNNAGITRFRQGHRRKPARRVCRHTGSGSIHDS